MVEAVRRFVASDFIIASLNTAWQFVKTFGVRHRFAPGLTRLGLESLTMAARRLRQIGSSPLGFATTTSCAEMLPRLLMLATLGKQAYLTHNRKLAELRCLAMMG